MSDAYEATIAAIRKQRDTLASGEIHWPKGGGFPVRGKTDAVLSRKQLGHNLQHEVRSGVFRTWVAEELAAYETVLQWSVGGRCRLLPPMLKEYVPDRQGWVLQVNWVTTFDVPPRDQGEADRLEGRRRYTA